MDFRSVVLMGVAVSLVLSSILAWVILPPIRGVLRRVCSSDDLVAFWMRFTVLMLFLGPLLVTLIFGVPYSELSLRLTPFDLAVRAVSAALVGGFLTVGAIGLRIGTIRSSEVAKQMPRKSDDERIR
jgi:hypothetical protein